MICGSCGSEQKDGAKFCTKCGAKLTPPAGEKNVGSRGPLSATEALVAVVATVVVGAVVIVAGLTTNWFGLAAPASQAVTDTAAQVGLQPNEGGAGVPTAAPEASSEPEVRAAVADYSWEELSEISRLISSAASGSEAVAIAARYHLCAEDGTLDGTQTKSFTLANGTSVTMRVTGFNQDELSSGSGRAGITFSSSAPVATRAYNASGSTAGGWRDSELRAWMNGELLGLLPDDVAAAVVPVDKPTNAVGETSDGSAVVMTSDTLWTLSYSELGGAMSTGDPHDAVFNAEGEQYQLFANQGVRWDGPNSFLQMSGGMWWERTPDPMDGRFVMCVGEDGAPWCAHAPYKEFGVVLCFCV